VPCPCADRIPSNAHLLHSSIIFGRAIKNEYLALGTIFGVGGIAWAAKSGGKKEVAQSSGQSLVDKVKEAVPINADSRCVMVPLLWDTLNGLTCRFSLSVWVNREEEDLYVTFDQYLA
jgi:hypothetical protein